MAVSPVNPDTSQVLMIRRVANGWVFHHYAPYMPGSGGRDDATFVAMTPAGLGRQVQEWAEGHIGMRVEGPMPEGFMPGNSERVGLQSTEA